MLAKENCNDLSTLFILPVFVPSKEIPLSFSDTDRVFTVMPLGLSKKAATKFTFLLSVPIIAGATILKVGDLSLNIETFVGVFVSFIVGIFSIKFLLNYIKKHDFSVFAIYRVVFAIIILVKYFVF